MGGDEVVQHRVPQELESLVALCELVARVARVGQRLQKEALLFERVAEDFFYAFREHGTIKSFRSEKGI